MRGITLRPESCQSPILPPQPLTAAPIAVPTPSAALPSRPLRVAVLGATGAVGQELLTLLAERRFPVAELTLLASPRSAGQVVMWQGQELGIRPV
jgi:aspartate-semialdehyde dehydrogenase